MTIENNAARSPHEIRVKRDRRETVRVFRARLRDLIALSGETRSAFAAGVGIDRSTLSQLLDEENVRLPRADTVASIAARHRVSADWLLGLSEEGSVGADVVSRALEIEAGAASPNDARLMRWHAEAAGYKIRYVPATLPDLLKTEDVIRHEFHDHGLPVRDARVEQASARLAYSRRPESDIEVCSTFQSIEEFAFGEGIWRGLAPAVRRAALAHMAKLVRELYPTLRWFLYDGLARYCVPLTIFGPKRVAVYFGNMYFVFNSTEHIRVLTDHFDGLIRGAVTQPPDVADHLESLLERLGRTGNRARPRAVD